MISVDVICVVGYRCHTSILQSVVPIVTGLFHLVIRVHEDLEKLKSSYTVSGMGNSAAAMENCTELPKEKFK